MPSILIRFLDCFDEQKIYLAPWRVLGIDKRNDQKRQQPQAKPADVLISAAKHGGGERNYFINGILLRTNA